MHRALTKPADTASPLPADALPGQPDLFTTLVVSHARGTMQADSAFFDDE